MKQDTTSLWLMEEHDEDHSSISSEEEAGSGSDSEMRAHIISGPMKDIWPRNQVTKHLKSLPGGEELWNLVENGDAAQVMMHQHAATTGLLIAAWTGNHPMLAAIMDGGAVPTVTDMLGRSALHLATSSGSPSCVETLLNKGASVKTWDNQHLATPLHCAASVGSLACVRLLVNAGAEVNAGITCRSPLHYAVQSGATDCIRELLQAGASPNTLQVYTETPLHMAAAMVSAVSVQLLLEHGADVHVQIGPTKS